MCATSGALPQLLQQPSQITSHPSQIATTKTCMHHTKHSYFFTLQGYDIRARTKLLCCHAHNWAASACCTQGAAHIYICNAARQLHYYHAMEGGTALKLLTQALIAFTCHAPALNWFLQRLEFSLGACQLG